MSAAQLNSFCTMYIDLHVLSSILRSVVPRTNTEDNDSLSALCQIPNYAGIVHVVVNVDQNCADLYTMHVDHNYTHNINYCKSCTVLGI